MDRDVRPAVGLVSRRSIGGLIRTHTLVDQSRLMPVLWAVTSPLQREPDLEGTTCPTACAPAEYHTQQMLQIIGIFRKTLS